MIPIFGEHFGLKHVKTTSRLLWSVRQVLDVSELRALRDRKAELRSVQCAVDEHPQLNGLAWVNPVRVSCVNQFLRLPELSTFK